MVTPQLSSGPLGSGIAFKMKRSQLYFSCTKSLFLLLLVALGCTKEIAPNAPIPEPEKPILRGVHRLQGFWKVISGPTLAKFFIADTMISHFITNEDCDYNFRYVWDAEVLFTDSTILSYGGLYPLYHYRFSSQSDTLFISYDSLYRHPYIAVTDSAPNDSKLWCPTISYDSKTVFNSSAYYRTYDVDRYGDYWYIREDGPQCSILDIRNLNRLTVKLDTFPGVTSIDISGGYLWTAGSYFVDQRNVADTTLIRRIDLSSQYSFQQGDLIHPLAVSDSFIVAATRENLLCFDLSGQFIRRVPTYDGIFSMSFVGDALVGGTNLSTICTIDITTGEAVNNYLLPEGLFGDTIYPIVGIVPLGDHVGAFRQHNQAIYLYEFTFPE